MKGKFRAGDGIIPKSIGPTRIPDYFQNKLKFIITHVIEDSGNYIVRYDNTQHEWSWTVTDSIYDLATPEYILNSKLYKELNEKD